MWFMSAIEQHKNFCKKTITYFTLVSFQIVHYVYYEMNTKSNENFRFDHI